VNSWVADSVVSNQRIQTQEFLMSVIGIQRRPLKEIFLNFALRPARKFLSDALLDSVCRNVGMAFRRRLLTPGAVVLCCVFSHLQGGKSLRIVENWFFSFGESASKRYGRALSKARAKLPATVFYSLIQELGGFALGRRAHRWRGLNVVLVDGTTQAIARSTENSSFFGHSGNQHRKSCHPLARMLWMTCAGTGACLSCMVGGYRTSEMSMLLRLLPDLQTGSLLIGDSAFGSWRVLWELAADRRHGIFVRHPSRKLECDAWEGPADYIETWRRPPKGQLRTGPLPENAPDVLAVRVIRQKVSGRWLTLCTTLLDARRWPADEIVALYARRWTVETGILWLKKQHLQPIIRAKGARAAVNEILSGILAYNVTRVVVAEATDEAWRVSHMEARELIVLTGERMREAHVCKLLAIYDQLLEQIRHTRSPKQERPPHPRTVLPRPAGYPIRSEFKTKKKAA
jgi:hypothetical protein